MNFTDSPYEKIMNRLRVPRVPHILKEKAAVRPPEQAAKICHADRKTGQWIAAN